MYLALNSLQIVNTYYNKKKNNKNSGRLEGFYFSIIIIIFCISFSCLKMLIPVILTNFDS